MNIYKKISNSTISSVLLAIGAVAGIAATPASATTFSLGELISNNESFTVGDKLFSNFSCSIIGIGTPSTCDEINVITLEDADFGIRFQGGFSATAPNTVKFSLGYDVKASEEFLISDVEMLFNGAVLPSTSDGKASVTETVTNLDPLTILPLGAELAEITVTNPPPIGNISAMALLAENVKKVHVQKEVELVGGTNGLATISFIDQRFSQVPDTRITTPEPASSLGLLAFGSLGIALRRKKA